LDAPRVPPRIVQGSRKIPKADEAAGKRTGLALNIPGVRALRVGDGWFDPVGGDLTLGGSTSRLRPRTAALFTHLIRHAGRIVSKDELMQAVWPDVVVTEDSLVQCVKEIRQALGEGGRDWIRTVPRQGYAFVDRAGPVPAQPAALPATPATSRRSMPRTTAGLVVVVLAAMVAGGLAWQRLRQATPGPAAAIMVLPLVNRTQGAVAEEVVDELTERLTGSLSRVPGTLVIASGTAFSFKGQPADARRIGSDLGVRYVLEGSLRQQPPRLALDVRLVDASNAAQLWSDQFTADSGDTQALRDEVLARVANSLGLRLMRAEADRSRRERPVDPGAADLLTRALAALRWSGYGEQGYAEARALLEEAVQRDPQVADAWALLAMAYSEQTRFSNSREQMLQRAKAAADRAVALAPDSALSHYAKGRALYNQGGAMNLALAEFDLAIELNPNEPTQHGHRSAALTCLGRPEEALVAVGRAMALSPRDPQFSWWLMFQGVAYLHLRRDGDAVKVLQRSVEMNPSSAFGRLFLASALGSMGDLPAARREVAALTRLAPGFTLTRMREREPSDELAFRMQRQHVYEGLRRAGLPE
jgi:TolB-like protein/DNA-binding winged helix-turn-helix (wHTH) protein/Tfp pilus assembly protein PilF